MSETTGEVNNVNGCLDMSGSDGVGTQTLHKGALLLCVGCVFVKMRFSGQKGHCLYEGSVLLKQGIDEGGTLFTTWPQDSSLLKGARVYKLLHFKD
eukprot:6363864-Amphidinium_carterae.1